MVNIRVYLRIRPSKKDSAAAETCLAPDPTRPSSISCTNQNQTTSETFDFDGIFDKFTPQKDVFEV